MATPQSPELKPLPLCLSQYSEQLSHIFAEHRVQEAWLFGSAATAYFDPAKSDIDLLVSLQAPSPEEEGALLLSLWDTLEATFSKKVDLLTSRAIKNPYLSQQIEKTKKMIYG